MAAARYWRISAVETYGSGSDLELAGAALLDAGGSLNAVATVTSTAAPSSGSIANLKDTNTSTICRFASSSVTSPGIAIMWDFGAGVTKSVTTLRLTGSASASTFPYAVTVESSSNGTFWNREFSTLGIVYPGQALNYDCLATVDYDPYLEFSGTNPSGVWSYGYSPQPGQNYSMVQFDELSDEPTARVWRKTGYQISTTPSVWKFIDAANNGRMGLHPGPNAYGDIAILRFTAPSAGNYGAEGQFYAGDYGAMEGAVLLKGDPINQPIRFNPTDDSSAFVLSPVALNAGQTIDFIVGNNGNYVAGSTPLRVVVKKYVSQSVLKPTLPIYRESESLIQNRQSVGNTSARADPPTNMIRDMEDFGLFQITGTVFTKGTPNTPVARKVQLFNERSGRKIRQTWSDPATGAYSFDYIRGDQTYFVVSFDYANDFRAVIADNLTPSPMP